jgi:hypothetical protein
MDMDFSFRRRYIAIVLGHATDVLSEWCAKLP